MKKIFLSIIKFYQLCISPNLGENCRFYPSCSEYGHQAIQKYGILKGTWRGLKRILRCGFWSRGGMDQP